MPYVGDVGEGRGSGKINQRGKKMPCGEAQGAVVGKQITNNRNL